MDARRETRRRACAAPLALLLAVTGCSVGPNYVRPSAPVETTYKELEGWKQAEPRDHLPRGPWWERYGDAKLSELEEQVAAANQDLVQAAARYREAQALVANAKAAWWPTVTIGASTTRARQSATLGTSFASGKTTSDYAMPLEATWELDLWGRIRRNVESNEASAQASAADLENTRLSLQSALAVNYFQLRSLDAQGRLFDETIATYEKSLRLTQSRYKWGVASGGDVAVAATQLESTRALATDVALSRAQLEHAIAVLIGVPAGEFSLAAEPLAATPPEIPVGVPSELLERRPDVATFERDAAAANAQIGVAKAAYYPTVSLGASGGLESTHAADWFTWPSRFWAVGPSVTETIFDGGARGALTDQARAVYDQQVGAYRQSVLAAFQNVEDQLAALRLLEDETRQQDAAVAAARDATRITYERYKAGTASYLDLAILQTSEFNNERTAADLMGRRMVASVLLIQALGGGWSAEDLPTRQDVASD
jgi:NodT family efflux transporter outer membrane factor (OMF) lipoprotein